MDYHHLKAMDALDACIFSSDLLDSAACRDELRDHLRSWTLALDDYEATLRKEGSDAGAHN
jgi:hypothetical protein